MEGGGADVFFEAGEFGGAGDGDRLIADMQKSIDESNQFIGTMKTP